MDLKIAAKKQKIILNRVPFYLFYETLVSFRSLTICFFFVPCMIQSTVIPLMELTCAQGKAQGKVITVSSTVSSCDFSMFPLLFDAQYCFNVNSR